MTCPDNQVVTYGYDSSSAVTSIDVKQNSSSSAHSVADYVYDNMVRVTDVLFGGNSLATYQYASVDNGIQLVYDDSGHGLDQL